MLSWCINLLAPFPVDLPWIKDFMSFCQAFQLVMLSQLLIDPSIQLLTEALGTSSFYLILNLILIIKFDILRKSKTGKAVYAFTFCHFSNHLNFCPLVTILILILVQSQCHAPLEPGRALLRSISWYDENFPLFFECILISVSLWRKQSPRVSRQ